MARPRLPTLSQSSIARYQRAARAGNTTAQARLQELGISVVQPRKTGRPRKVFSELSRTTQKQYAKNIAKNIRDLKKLDKQYEVHQPYRKVTSSAEVLGILHDQVYGAGTANVYFEQLRQYSRGNSVSTRLKEIRENYLTNEGVDISGLTESEQREYYESKYFVLTESNEYDSEGLRMYYEENAEKLSETRFKDFLSNVLLSRYAPNSQDYARIQQVYNSI